MGAGEVLGRGRPVMVPPAGRKGKPVWDYKPFGAAARLFNWLREQREERRKFARGEVERVYEKGKSAG